MKKTTFTIAGLLALIALVAVPILYAGPGRMHHRMAAEGMDMGIGPLAHLQKAQQELGLSDQQVSEIKTIFQDLRTQNAAYREQLHGGLKGVIDTLVKNPDDVAGAQAIIDQQTQAKRAAQVNVLNAASKALKVLTPEQRTKLSEKIAERHARRANRQQF
jgi:Spy/CpxP family protein refolding chaperone